MRAALLVALACLVAGIVWWIQQSRGCDAHGPVAIEGAAPEARSEDILPLPADPTPPRMSREQWETLRAKQARRRDEEDRRAAADGRRRVEEATTALRKERADVDHRIAELQIEIPAAAADPERLERLQVELARLVARRQGLR